MKRIFMVVLVVVSVLSMSFADDVSDAVGMYYNALNSYIDYDHRAAMEELDILIEKYPDFYLAYSLRAEIYFDFGRWRSTISDIDKFFELVREESRWDEVFTAEIKEMDSTSAYYLRGKAEFKLAEPSWLSSEEILNARRNLYISAIDDLTESLRRMEIEGFHCTTKALVLYYRGMSYMEMASLDEVSDYSRAEEDFLASIELDSEHEWTYIQLCVLYWDNEEKMDSALDYMLRAATLSPEAAYFFFRNGNTFMPYMKDDPRTVEIMGIINGSLEREKAIKGIESPALEDS